jgi:hypothetical protein
MPAAAVAAQPGGNVRVVALDLQHAPIDRELTEAFGRLLGSSAYTLGAEVERFEDERPESPSVHYRPAVHAHPAWKREQLRHGVVRQAEAWAAEELSLPMHPGLVPDEIERVADAVHAAVFIPTGRSGAKR